MDADSRHVLDVRELEQAPFGPIAEALGELPAGDELHLIAPFEPKPLYEVLDARGFDHETERVSDAEWHVRVSHR